MEAEMMARVLCVQSQIDAVKVEVEGMKAINEERKHRGEAMAYGEAEFIKAAEEIRTLGNDLHNLGYT